MADFAINQPKTSVWANRKCLTVCGIIAIANMQYGFDSAAIAGLQAMPGFLQVFGYVDPESPIGYNITSTVQQLIISMFVLGAFVASLTAGAFGRFLGRKTCLWLACLVNFAACGIQAGTTSKGVLYLGRIFLGFSNGFYVTFSNTYIAEVAPAHLRGVLVALYAYWMSVGQIIGGVVDNYTKDRMDKSAYQIPIACLCIVPLLLSVGLFFVPESPRWLLHRGKEQQARLSLETIRANSMSPQCIDLEWIEILRGIEEEKSHSKSVELLDIFRGANLRRTLLCYGVMAAQNFSGSWFLIAFQTYFLAIAGITKAFQFTIMNTCLGLLGVICGMYTIRHLAGRRVVCMVGYMACGMCFLSMAVAGSVKATGNSAGNAMVGFAAIFQFFYNGCVNSTSYILVTELVSSRLRVWTVGSATSVGCILSWVTLFISPYFINPEDLNWGPKYGYIWAGFNFAFVIFYYICLPETKDRSLEELDELFENRVSAKQFQTYQTTVKDMALCDLKGERVVWGGQPRLRRGVVEDGDRDNDKAEHGSTTVIENVNIV